ncbi:hypothetical protein AOL_s00091g28 [Orbilia oligospora ATCC 24927]|uniref:Uncharacterized protein n=1 Tax=Arthrobotrys oligospora (strain ATCC 24927 / CBS 115.81 / DSM 1491) TaxID=756982 RepID=G1XHX6_ARTOA|nr:hypothetical protein AOL_s00091g28 [Orbilia oligospora ATCC 24927]EGX47207.1 hypothetical protein AOL_s00091g28 [Orbilia oligospora ATCC 24927]
MASHKRSVSDSDILLRGKWAYGASLSRDLGQHLPKPTRSIIKKRGPKRSTGRSTHSRSITNKWKAFGLTESLLQRTIRSGCNQGIHHEDESGPPEILSAAFGLLKMQKEKDYIVLDVDPTVEKTPMGGMSAKSLGHALDPENAKRPVLLLFVSDLGREAGLYK